jgi:AraC-like DNA-binding protein
MDARSRAAPIAKLAFAHPAELAATVEVKSFAQLRSRAADGHLGRPLRLNFHLLVYARRGGGAHAVDFTRVPLRTGSVVATHPGQIQWFEFDPGAEGDVILFLPTAIGGDAVIAPFLDPLRSASIGLVPSPRRGAVERAIAAVRDAAAEPAGDERTRALLRYELCALLIRLHRWLAVDARAVDPLVDGFARDVEARYADSRNVTEYARRRGCSVRTLSRAVRCVRGQTPKQYIDDRIALEAKRVLAYGDDPIATISERLGFSEPTNFAKFFRRASGMSPASFRNTYGDRGQSRG